MYVDISDHPCSELTLCASVVLAQPPHVCLVWILSVWKQLDETPLTASYGCRNREYDAFLSVWLPIPTLISAPNLNFGHEELGFFFDLIPISSFFTIAAIRAFIDLSD